MFCSLRALGGCYSQTRRISPVCPMKKIPAIAVLVLIARLSGAAADFDVATSTNQLGLDVYRQFAAKEPDKNLIISPYSIQSALTLVYAGAEGVTRNEMSTALHLPLGESQVRQPFAVVRNALAKISTNSAAIEWH